MRRRLKNEIKVFNSVPWCIGILFVVALYLAAEIGVYFFNLVYGHEVFLYLMLAYMFLLTVIPIIIARRGLMYAGVSEEYIEGRIIGKCVCHYAWSDVKSVVCFKSLNYCYDSSTFLLISNKPIEFKKNAAFSYHCKTQILVNLKSKKTPEVLAIIEKKLNVSITPDVINSANFDTHIVIK